MEACTVPLGHEGKDKTLVVNKMEAEAVRAIFRPYLELQSFKRLVADLARGPNSAKNGPS
jgi:site-specific DNA recombinase